MAKNAGNIPRGSVAQWREILKATEARRYGQALRLLKSVEPSPERTRAIAEIHFRRGITQQSLVDLEHALALEPDERNVRWYVYALIREGKTAQAAQVAQGLADARQREKALKALMAHGAGGLAEPKWAAALRASMRHAIEGNADAAEAGAGAAPTPAVRMPKAARAVARLFDLAASLRQASAWTPEIAATRLPLSAPTPALEPLWRWCVRAYVSLALGADALAPAAKVVAKTRSLFQGEELEILELLRGADAAARRDWPKAARHWHGAPSWLVDQPLALAHERMHQPDQALALWRRIYTRMERDLRDQPEALVDLRLHMAELLAQSGQRREAAAAYDQAFRLGEDAVDDPDVFARYASLDSDPLSERRLWALGRYTEKRPDDAAAAADLVQAAVAQNRFDAALSGFERAVGAQPSASGQLLLYRVTARAWLVASRPLRAVIERFPLRDDPAFAAVSARLDILAVFQQSGGDIVARLDALPAPSGSPDAIAAAQLFEGWARGLAGDTPRSRATLSQAGSASDRRGEHPLAVEAFTAGAHIHMSTTSLHAACNFRKDKDFLAMDRHIGYICSHQAGALAYLAVTAATRWTCQAMKLEIAYALREVDLG